MNALIFTRSSVCCLALLVSALVGCGSETVEPTNPDVATLYWRLEVDRPAITLSIHQPYDTVRVTATPVNVFGRPVPKMAEVSFEKSRLTDTTFSLSPDGVIAAKAVTSSSTVIASLTMGSIKRSTEIKIKITNDPVVRKIRAINVNPVAPDSTWRWSTFGDFTINHAAYYAAYTGTDSVVPNGNWLRWFISRNPTIVDFDLGTHSTDGRSVNALGLVGEAWVIMRAFAYGEDFIDSVLIRSIESPVKAIQVARVTPAGGGATTFAFLPGTLTIPVGGTVVFGNPWSGIEKPIDIVKLVNGTTPVRYTSLNIGDSIDVVFDDSVKVAPGHPYAVSASTLGLQLNGYAFVDVSDATGLGGNIPAWTGAEWRCRFFVGDCPLDFRLAYLMEPPLRARSFPIAGTYRYHSRRYPNATGTIVVR